MALTLIILDGWGHSDIKANNAIANANTPCWDGILKKYPHTLLEASGESVGLPINQMGNSEVGHATIGAGRVLSQDLTRINNAIADKSFEENNILKQAMTNLHENKSLHLVGLLSDGGVHAHIEHMCAAINMAKKQGVKQLYIHAILDGRDTLPSSAKQYIAQIEQHCHDVKLGKIATIIGRYYAMDRDNNLDRTEQAFNLLTKGQSNYNNKSAIKALEHYYGKNITDEFIPATVINANGIIQENDTVIFTNFRNDRAIQLARKLNNYGLKNFTCFTKYFEGLVANIAFPKQTVKNSLGEIISKNNLKQLRIAETEKYAHVTFFFNGGETEEFAGEQRILIDSPKVATYDAAPEMSAQEITAKVIASIASDAFDVIICNYANADMVGHTGKFRAAVKAAECIDTCLQEIINITKKIAGEIIITADHGNIECMSNEKNMPHTAHTTAKVPFVYVGENANITSNNGTLSDVAPTILKLLKLKIPNEMTGKNLLQLK